MGNQDGGFEFTFDEEAQKPKAKSDGPKTYVEGAGSGGAGGAMGGQGPKTYVEGAGGGQGPKTFVEGAGGQGPKTHVEGSTMAEGAGGGDHGDDEGHNLQALIGRKVDRYFIKKLLGEGGFGAVYLAEHTLMKRDVAFKTLHKELAADPAILYRFKREGQCSGRFKHKHAIELYDFGQMDDGTFFMAMEFMNGSELRDILKAKGSLEVGPAFDIMLMTLGAVQAMHDGGVIHRDLKPDNIICIENEGRDDFVKVFDFGIAKLHDDTAEGEPRSDDRGFLDVEYAQSDQQYKTQVGAFFGTPEYGSPEQCAGEEIDARSDLYTMGCILYECLSGQLPFSSKTPQGYLAQHMVAQPKAIRELDPELEMPEEVEELVQKSMAKEPDERFQTAAEFAEAIVDCAQKCGIEITVDVGQTIIVQGTPLWKVLTFTLLPVAAAVAIYFGFFYEPPADNEFLEAKDAITVLRSANNYEGAIAKLHEYRDQWEGTLEEKPERAKWLYGKDNHEAIVTYEQLELVREAGFVADEGDEEGQYGLFEDLIEARDAAIKEVFTAAAAELAKPNYVAAHAKITDEIINSSKPEIVSAPNIFMTEEERAAYNENRLLPEDERVDLGEDSIRVPANAFLKRVAAARTKAADAQFQELKEIADALWRVGDSQLPEWDDASAVYDTFDKKFRAGGPFGDTDPVAKIATEKEAILSHKIANKELIPVRNAFVALREKYTGTNWATVIIDVREFEAGKAKDFANVKLSAASYRQTIERDFKAAAEKAADEYLAAIDLFTAEGGMLEADPKAMRPGSFEQALKLADPTASEFAKQYFDAKGNLKSLDFEQLDESGLPTLKTFTPEQVAEQKLVRGDALITPFAVSIFGDKNIIEEALVERYEALTKRLDAEASALVAKTDVDLRKEGRPTEAIALLDPWKGFSRRQVRAPVTKTIARLRKIEPLHTIEDPGKGVIGAMALIPGTTGYRVGDAYYSAGNPPQTNGAGQTIGDFLIDKHEVTNKEFLTYLVDNGLDPIADGPPTWRLEDANQQPWNQAKGPFDPAIEQHPVRGVSFELANAYAEWAGKRLPTEFEWEYVGRGPEPWRMSDGAVQSGALHNYFPWGETVPLSDEQRKWARISFDRDRGAKTLPVGSSPKDATRWWGAGVYDLSGNVREWTASLFMPYNSPAPKTKFYDSFSFSAKKRVIRGASYLANEGIAARLGVREGADPKAEIFDVGFRCAKTIR